MTPIRVAIAGAGYFAALHRDGWERVEGVRIVGVADRDAPKAEATGYPAFGSIAGMLNAARPDILDIALPPDAHAGAIRQGIAAGVPVVVCQKPFCRDLAEAEAVTGEAEAAGISLIVHENFRFQPWYRAIRSAIGEGRIGTLLQGVVRLRPGDGQGPEAYLARQPYFRGMPRFLIHETGVHFIDLFRFIAGAPEAVYADLRRLNPAIRGEDAGLVVFDYPGGARLVFDGNRHLDHAADNSRRTMGEALFEGTGGALSLDGSGAVTLRRFGQREAQVILPPDESAGFGGDCVHLFQAHVARAIRGEGSVETPARDYLAVLRIEAAVYASAEAGAKRAL